MFGVILTRLELVSIKILFIYGYASPVSVLDTRIHEVFEKYIREKKVSPYIAL